MIFAEHPDVHSVSLAQRAEQGVVDGDFHFEAGCARFIVLADRALELRSHIPGNDGHRSVAAGLQAGIG